MFLRVILILISLSPLMVQPVLASESEKCDPLEKELVSTQSPPTNKYSLESLKNTVVPEKVDLAVLGDSIARQVYNGKLAVAVNSTSPFLLAGGGDGFQHAIYRLRFFKEKLQKVSPQKIVIIIGTNNYSSPLCALEFGFETYLSEIRSIWKNSAIYVVPVIPRGSLFSLPEQFLKYNNYLKNNADKLSYAFVGIDQARLSCGIVSPAAEETLKWLESYGDGKEGQYCTSVAETVSRDIHKWGDDVSIDCSVTLKLSCNEYNSDNIHLSNNGVVLLNNWISEAIGKFSNL